MRAPVQAALTHREAQAVTWPYFSTFLGDLARRPIAEAELRRQISRGFTLDYLNFRDGDIVTGIRGLTIFDDLSRDFPRFDCRVLAGFMATCGLAELIEPHQTSTDRWISYVEATGHPEALLFTAAVRWISGAMHTVERQRPVPPSQLPGEFHSLDGIRSRILARVRQSLRLTAGADAPRSIAAPRDSFEAAHRLLLWTAGELSKDDRALERELEMTRSQVMLTRADVVVVTVNEIETTSLRHAFAEIGQPPQLHLGHRNTYSIYGPIGGAVVAHVRCSMGSGGPGGAQLTVSDAIRELEPWAVLAVGVAFGMDENRQPIGQLLLSERLTSYELQRVGEMDVVSRGSDVPCSPTLLSRFRDIGLASELGIDLLPCQLLSGEKLIDNADFKRQLLDRFPDAMGGEMEGAGVFSASYRSTVEWLVVKAVCDYAEKKHQDKQERQLLASQIAARAFVHVLKRGGLARGPATR
ncbi:hypothetical protein [Microlunatus speluncae]|uniref:5'-methylthioadenosine/S-adenosylhomocysteine nucleosidase family protein n=1 Tax=Microlunatus speluncae TaxID=2594267 RepID=UPI001375CA6B|nr:hypothetical protein [Microlunatus speluncae]